MESTVRAIVVKIDSKDGMMERQALPGDDESRVQLIQNEYNDSTRSVIRFNCLEGHIRRLYLVAYPDRQDRMHQYLRVKMVGVGQELVLQMYFNSAMARSFLSRYEHIDLDQPCRIRTGMGDKGPILWIEQYLKTVKMKYTKANPHDMPQWIQNADGRWDSTPQMKWWEVKLLSYDRALVNTYGR